MQIKNVIKSFFQSEEYKESVDMHIKNFNSCYIKFADKNFISSLLNSAKYKVLTIFEQEQDDNEVESFFTHTHIDKSVTNRLLANDITSNKYEFVYLLTKNDKLKDLVDAYSEYDHVYLSLCNLKYSSDKFEINSGLCFLKVKFIQYLDNVLLSLDNSNLIFNEILIDHIKYKFKVDLNYSFSTFNLNKFVQFIKDKLDGTDVNINFDNYITANNIASNNILFEEFRTNVDEKKINPKLQVFENNIIPNQSNMTFEEIRSILDKEGYIHIHSNDIDAEDIFTKRAVTDLINFKHKALFITKNETSRKKSVERLFKGGLKGLYNSESIGSLKFNLINNLSNSTLYDLSNYLDEVEKAKYKDFISLRDKYIAQETDCRRSCQNVLGLSYSKLCNEYLRVASITNVKLDVNLSTYTSDDFTIDTLFFKSLSKYESLLNINIKEHPYYGFDYLNKDVTAVDIRKLSKNINESIFKLKNLIANYELENYKLGRIRSVKQIESFLNNLYQVTAYNGNDIQYRDIVENPMAMLSFEDLKNKDEEYTDKKHEIGELFNSISFISNNNVAKLYDSIILDNEESKESIKTVKSNLSKMGNYNKFMDLMPEFKIVESEYFRLLKDNEQYFGDALYDVQGISRIDKALSFFKELDRYSKEHSDDENTDFNSDEVNNLIIDRNQKHEFKVNIIPELDRCLQQLINQLDRFRRIYKYVKVEYNSLEFSDLENFFKNKENIDDTSFDFLNKFFSDISMTSTSFQLFFEEFFNKDLKLIDAENIFLFNLYKSILEKINNQVLEKENEILISRKLYINSLKDNKEILNKIDFSNLTHVTRSQYPLTGSFKNTSFTVNSLFDSNFIVSYKDVLRIAQSSYSTLYPITVDVFDNLSVYDDIEFDYVLVDNTIDFTSSELLALFNKFKSLIFLTFGDVEDNRLGSMKACFINSFTGLNFKLTYNSLSESFIQNVEKLAERYGTKLDREYVENELVLSAKLKENRNIIVIPDCIFEVAEVNKLCTESFRFFVNMLNLEPLFIRSCFMALYEEETLKKVDNFYSLIVKNDSSNKENCLKAIEQLKAEILPHLSLEEINFRLKNKDYQLLLKSLLPAKINFLRSLKNIDFLDYLNQRLEDKTLVTNLKEGTILFSVDELNKIKSYKEGEVVDLSSITRLELSNFVLRVLELNTETTFEDIFFIFTETVIKEKNNSEIRSLLFKVVEELILNEIVISNNEILNLNKTFRLDDITCDK